MKRNAAQLTFPLARPALPVLAPMARRSDMGTSHEAAESVEPRLGKIQREVLAALAKHGPLTARALEALPEFERYGFSTTRKRLSELSKSGHVVACGVDRSQAAPATVWRIA